MTTWERVIGETAVLKGAGRAAIRHLGSHSVTARSGQARFFQPLTQTSVWLQSSHLHTRS